MLFEQIKTVVDKAQNEKIRGDYIIYLIKEYLQNIVLEYIYNNKTINNKLIFTGGTCLRFCFGLPRLSEDLDFDCEVKLDHEIIAHDIKNYFQQVLKYYDTDFSIKGKDRKIYLKFPLLRQLGLEFEGSSLLLLKIEISRSSMLYSNIETSLVEKTGRTYFLKRYSLPDLMAGKIHAFLTRLFFKGKENEIDFKGRDMYDLIWFMGKDIIPNTKRLPILFKGTGYEKMKWQDILKDIHTKAKNIKKTFIYQDLINFIENASSIDNFLDNYLNIADQYYIKHSLHGTKP